MTVYTIVELSPMAQTVGILPPGWLDEIVTPSPMGDVADNSDATYTTLGGERTSTVGVRAGLLSCTFQYAGAPAPSGFMHMRVRAKNSSAYLSNPSWINDIFSVEALYLDGDEVLDNWVQTPDPSGTGGSTFQLQQLADGEVSTPTWFRFFYLNGQHNIDPAEPTGDTWRPLGYDSGYTGGRMLDALQGGGLRVAMYARINTFDAGWMDVANLYEVRLVFAVPVPGFVYGGLPDNPVTRLLPRDDTRGVSGPNRLVPLPRANRIVGKQP